MEEKDVKDILKKYGLNGSKQFYEFAIKFNSKDLIVKFCEFWKNRPVGGGDLNMFFLQNYKKKLGD